MKKIITAFVLGSLMLTGCPKHEIIPAPEPKVELDASFEGNINGTPTEISIGINGYTLDANKIKTILPSPTLSKANYFAELKSSNTLTSVRITLGSVLFDAGNGSSDPSVTAFRDFFTNNTAPTYQTGADGGFEVVYRDNSGAVWTSKPSDPPQNVLFTNIEQEADASGEYNKFKCTFSCKVYRTVGPDEFTLTLSNCEYIGWFKL